MQNLALQFKRLVPARNYNHFILMKNQQKSVAFRGYLIAGPKDNSKRFFSMTEAECF